MKVFFTEQIGKKEWRDQCALEQGQPLLAWWKDAQDAFIAAGSPAGKIVIRNRVAMDGYDADTHDGLRSGSFSCGTMIREVGVL